MTTPAEVSPHYLLEVPHHGLVSVCFQNRADKKRLNIIIVAEGAIDCHNKAITPDYIKDVSKQTEPAEVVCQSDSDFTFSPVSLAVSDKSL